MNVSTSTGWAFKSVVTDASTMVEIRCVTSHQKANDQKKHKNLHYMACDIRKEPSMLSEELRTEAVKKNHVLQRVHTWF